MNKLFINPETGEPWLDTDSEELKKLVKATMAEIDLHDETEEEDTK
tara:strand:+ start:420 stop:557 length:138 start_codon:yes stop_codon:yes gene_type:complete